LGEGDSSLIKESERVKISEIFLKIFFSIPAGQIQSNLVQTILG
jgi:hypothetical protein